MAGKANTIRNTIILEGEKQYKKAMADITAALKESKSAQRAAAAEFKASGEDMQKAAAYSEALAETYRQQGAQLEEMERHLKDVEEAYGKNSREATTLRTRINNTRTEMARTQGEMRDFEARLQNIADGGGDAAQGMQEISESMKESQEDAKGLVSELDKLVSGKLSGLMGGLTIGAMVKVGLDGLQAGDGVTRAENRVAAMTGLVGEELERVNEIAKRVYEQGFGEGLDEAANSTAILFQYTKESGENLYDMTVAAHALEETFGMDIPESARTAAQMMNTFGVSGVEAYNLIAAAAQEGADKHGNLLDTINEYAPYFEKAGVSAEEFLGALAAGTEHGVYDIDKIGDGMKEFTLRIGDGSETTTEALKNLGIEAADLPGKFAQGGEGAEAALALVIDKLYEVEDINRRNQIGVALFGEQWNDTAGALLPLFDQMTEGALEGGDAIGQMLSGRADELSTQLNIASRQLGSDFAEFFQPAAEDAANFLDDINQRAQQTGESYIEAAGTVANEAIEKKMGAAKAEFDEWAAGVKEGFDAWLDSPGGPLQEAATTYAAAAQAVGEEAASGIGAGLLAQNAEIQAAVEQTKADAVQVYSGLPDEAAQAITDSTPKVQAASEAMAQEAPAAMEAEKGTMQTATEAVVGEAEKALEAGVAPLETAGEGMGEATADGFAATAASTYAAAGSIVDGTVLELRRAIPGSYAAGYAAGSAFESGYRAATDTHSPSRKMQIASQDVLAGVFEPLEKAEGDIYARGAALGAALEGGYRGAGGLTAAETGTGGADGLSVEALTQALTEALSGLGLYASGEKIGQVGAESASREMNRASMESIAGRSNRIKGW